jgi:class 3 adenylate cyclase
VILSLDVVGSTKMATSLDPKVYSRMMAVLLAELGELVPLYHGHVLKYTGDGIIAYFPEPTFVAKNDLALSCALALRQLVYKAINDVFVAHELPTVGVRIGIDSGRAAVVVMGSSKTKQHADLIGKVVSLACKIQGRADEGGVCVGDIVLRNLHTSLRVHCREMPIPSDWPYRYADGRPYPFPAFDVAAETPDSELGALLTS